MYMMDDVSYQAAHHNVLKLFMEKHYSKKEKKKRALRGGVMRASDHSYPKVDGSNPEEEISLLTKM